jgi:nucleotide-binding universal stress UspA family protein
MNRIVVPLDGSDVAEKVLPYVTALAARSDAKLVLVSCVEPVAQWDREKGALRWDSEEVLASQYLVGVSEKILAPKGIGVELRVVYGGAGESILKVAEEENADLIAISTHGRSGIKRWVLGSVARKVLEGAEVPLLLVRAGAAAVESWSVSRVLVPLDGSGLAEQVLPRVKELASLFDLEVVLFTAVSPPHTYSGIEPKPPASWALVLSEMEASAKDYLSRTQATLRRDGLKVVSRYAVSPPTDGILAAAQDSRADLIAIATHGRSGLGRAIFGSVADAVVRRSGLPCLVIRPRETQPPE